MVIRVFLMGGWKILISVAILAGGKSRRMGRDKGWLEVGGRPIIERVLERIRPLSDDLLVSTNAPDTYRQLGLRLVPDIYPHKAALGGIYSVLQAAIYPHVLIVACDMPFLNSDLLRYLTSQATTADVVIPLGESGRPQTLHAVYSKGCLPAIKAQLLTDRLRLIDFFDDVSVHYIERDQVAQFDPNFYSFININTPADWHQAQVIAAALSS